MAIDEKGFKRRTFDEILSDKIAKAKELFGEDIETSELTPLGKFIRINAYDQALTEEEAEMIYYSMFPNTAVGVSLDRLCVFAGISRNAATCSRYIVTVTGTAGSVVPQGFLFGTESGVNFAVESDTTIGDEGTADVEVVCVETGEIGNVLVQEINQIVNPSADVDGVAGKSLVSKGEEVESDYELRLRFNEAKEGSGSCNEASIRAALLRVDGVTHAGVVSNETNGSFECFVHGGYDKHEDIAQAIFDKKPIGIKTVGDVEQTVTDDGGYTHVIKFSHTENVEVYVRVAISTNAQFEGTSGKTAIKDNLETYIDNVGIGNSVVLSSLYGQIHSVTGVTEVTELLLSTDGLSWSTGNISDIQPYQNCVCKQVEIKQGGGEYEVITDASGV